MLKDIINAEEYGFLKSDPRLGDNIILLGLGGSYSYGTNNESSDIDVRGCALNNRRDILLGKDFEQVTDTITDTLVFSFKKFVQLLINCNPNIIELLGLKPEHYFIVTDIGREFLDNTKLFLSQRAIKSFKGMADQQLQRLMNASTDERLREAKSAGRTAKQHKKLSKHAMHTVRVYYMGIDILEKGIVKTYRDKEHDLLMDIRNGKYLTCDDKPTAEYFELLESLRKRFEYAAANTVLPPEPDIDRIEDFVMSVNESVVLKPMPIPHSG